MAGLNATEIRVAGTGRVLVAPKNTPGPGDVTSEWPAEWEDLGFTSEDGVEFEQDDKVEPVPVWQSVAPVRFIYEERALNVKFELMQLNQRTVPIYFGGGAVTNVDGNIQIAIPAAPRPAEMAVGIEFTDDGGDGQTQVVHRFLMPRAVVTEAEEAVLTGTDAVKLPVKFTAMTPDTPELGPLAVWHMRDTEAVASDNGGA